MMDELIAKAKLDSDMERARQYTPEMVQCLRQAWIDERVISSIGDGGMKIAQARIHAEMHLNQWELNQLSSSSPRSGRLLHPLEEGRGLEW